MIWKREKNDREGRKAEKIRTKSEMVGSNRIIEIKGNRKKG